MPPPVTSSHYPRSDCSFPPGGFNTAPPPAGSVPPGNWCHPMRPNMDPLGNQWPPHMPSPSSYGMHLPHPEHNQNYFPGPPVAGPYVSPARFYPPVEQQSGMGYYPQQTEQSRPRMGRFPPPMNQFPPRLGHFNPHIPPPPPAYFGRAPLDRSQNLQMDYLPRHQMDHLSRPPFQQLKGLPPQSPQTMEVYANSKTEGTADCPVARLPSKSCPVRNYSSQECSRSRGRSRRDSSSPKRRRASVSPTNEDRTRDRVTDRSDRFGSRSGSHSRSRRSIHRLHKSPQRRSPSPERKDRHNHRHSQSSTSSHRLPQKSSNISSTSHSSRDSRQRFSIDDVSRHNMGHNSSKLTSGQERRESSTSSSASNSSSSSSSSDSPRRSPAPSSDKRSNASTRSRVPPVVSSEPKSSAVPYYDDEIDLEEELKEEISMWSRCSPSDLNYRRSKENAAVIEATPKLVSLLDKFEKDILLKASTQRTAKPTVTSATNRKLKLTSHYFPDSSDNDSLFSGDESDDSDSSAVHELERKRNHPNRLHEELWYNDAGEMNDGPLCRCSLKAKRSGIRHGLYPGEEYLKECDPHSNNADRLFHYRITMSPHTNFLTKAPTIIQYDSHEFIFEGFSMLSHYKLPKLPLCKVIRFNIEYTIHFMEEKLPENYTIRGLDLFCDYLYREVLELVDLDMRSQTEPAGCRRFHFFPRFARALEENGKEILSMNEVFSYLLSSFKPLIEEDELARLMALNQHEWQNFADEIKGMIVTYPGKKPCSLRVDQLDRDVTTPNTDHYPEIVHFGIRPLQLSYAGNPNYQKCWREYVKFRHLLANKPKVSNVDRHKLLLKEIRLQEMRTKSNLKRDVTIVVSSKGFYKTGIMCDIVQHAMLLPVLVCHLRFHKALDILEQSIGHVFEDRYLLQLALTHPSYRENFGTNPDHARNSLTNCGIRQPEYGDRRIHYMNTRKRGINTLINIMSRFGKHVETISNINHNERLEFLGDAVVEFLTSIHLFHLFPDIEEGGLATYRAAIVQNQHLAVLAKKLQLEKFMLYAHGSDLCHDLELRHAMANCFEALMGALFLDGGVDAADRVFSQTLFSDDLLDIWTNYPAHPIQEQEPDGDRHWIKLVPRLSKMTKFEDDIGVEFKHIRLLVRAFTHRSVGFNHLTLGSNQRMEFLGDTVLQLVASEYLYKYFPEHHEGHLSLLRSSLVNNRTQSVVCDDLGMVNYADYAYPKGELKIKDRADLLEAFLGALYVDKGLEHCRTFCQVCFFPRLQDFIMNQDWNDPKSKLQQCCLTLRTMDGGEPDIPIYKVIESKGPTNTRVFTVAVYFRGKRLAKGSGHSIQQAEMAAAGKALESSKADLFPQLNHQRRVIERSLKKQRLSQRGQ